MAQGSKALECSTTSVSRKVGTEHGVEHTVCKESAASYWEPRRNARIPTLSGTRALPAPFSQSSVMSSSKWPEDACSSCTRRGEKRSKTARFLEKSIVAFRSRRVEILKRIGTPGASNA